MSSHIDYQRFRKGEGCLEEGCRAKRFYIENGKKYCKEGHEQIGFTQTQQDEDDWNTQGKKTKKARVEKERVERIYTGRGATDLYLQCYMVLLMKQCHWLVTVKGFPENLEDIVKDLFEIRVKILYKEREAKSGYASSTIGFSSTEGETSDSEATEARSMTSSRRARKAKAKARENLPKLVESLAWCYLGMLWLKQPTSLGEVYKWAMTGEIVYTRAIQEIPKEMKMHLPSHYYAALEMRSPLKGADLHGAVLEHIEFYDLHIDMGSPTLNFPLLIYKHIRDLALPVEIYPAVRRLATLLNINFAYPTLHQRNYSVTAYPEIQLISLIVVATKLSQPFDSIKRHPESNSDPTALKMDWELWDHQMSSSEHVEGLKRGQEVKVNDEDIFEFGGKELDDYMDWYQRNFDQDRTPKKAAQIIEPFVLPTLPALQPVDEAALVERSEERLKQVQNGLIIQKPMPTRQAGNEEDDDDDNEIEDVTRPGELYRRWRTVDELPKSAKAFYEKAAENTGIFVQTLVKGVFETEKKLEEWQHAERKRLALE